jgi:hypothetical protein
MRIFIVLVGRFVFSGNRSLTVAALIGAATVRKRFQDTLVNL